MDQPSGMARQLRHDIAEAPVEGGPRLFLGAL